MAGEVEAAGDVRAVLEGEGIACRRGERLLFSDLSFALAAGDVLMLRGANGSGKSSLLRLIAGLIPPEHGRLLWRGRPVAADPDAYRAELSYLGHLDAVKLELTSREDLAFWLRLRGAGAATGARAEEALAALGLAAIADLPSRLLSAGQRRRLALARIAASQASVWLLDEPFTALDETGAAAVRQLIERHRRAGGVAIVALHGPSEFPDARSLDLDLLPAGRAGAP